MCFSVPWLKSHGCVLIRWLYFQRHQRYSTEPEQEKRKVGRMTKKKVSGAFLSMQLTEEQNLNLHKKRYSMNGTHMTASSISFYQLKSQNVCLLWLLTWSSEALLPLPWSLHLFSECCLSVCVVNIQFWGWQSGIRSVLGCGAADVRRRKNAILCDS